jgi:hypothetical protein
VNGECGELFSFSGTNLQSFLEYNVGRFHYFELGWLLGYCLGVS